MVQHPGGLPIPAARAEESGPGQVLVEATTGEQSESGRASSPLSAAVESPAAGPDRLAPHLPRTELQLRLVRHARVRSSRPAWRNGSRTPSRLGQATTVTLARGARVYRSRRDGRWRPPPPRAPRRTMRVRGTGAANQRARCTAGRPGSPRAGDHDGRAGSPASPCCQGVPYPILRRRGVVRRGEGKIRAIRIAASAESGHSAKSNIAPNSAPRRWWYRGGGPPRAIQLLGDPAAPSQAGISRPAHRLIRARRALA